jgi:hypothetical protein
VAATANGAGSVSTIVWIDPAGKIRSVVRTSPFAAFHVAFANDGTLWAVGRISNASFEDEPNHDILRQYDAEGRVLRTMLPSGGFSSDGKHPAYRSFLATSNDRIGLYCATANEWVELSLTGDVIGRWKTTGGPPIGALTGAAVTASGAVYVSAQRLIPSGKPPDAAARTEIYRLDKQSGSFLAVDSAQVVPADRVTMLLGSDDDRLVFYAKGTLSWVRAE